MSKLSSVIGNPLYMDQATALGTRLAFERVCIEVNVDCKFPLVFRMHYNGVTIPQKVENAMRPYPCKKCHMFNHNDKECLLKQQVK